MTAKPAIAGSGGDNGRGEIQRLLEALVRGRVSTVAFVIDTHGALLGQAGDARSLPTAGLAQAVDARGVEGLEREGVLDVIHDGHRVHIRLLAERAVLVVIGRIDDAAIDADDSTWLTELENVIGKVVPVSGDWRDLF